MVDSLHELPFPLLITAALLLDLLLGDPCYRLHPIRLIGKACEYLESLYRKLLKNEGAAGFCTFGSVLITTVIPTIVLLHCLYRVQPLLGDAAAVILLYTAFAIRDLLLHSKRIYRQLKVADLDRARAALSMIVGRNTEGLSSENIVKATIESVAENMADGITAPFFWAVVGATAAPFLQVPAVAGAAVAALLFKAVSTMDSMFGYKNERYLQFGRFAAKADDVVNFIPARLSGVCIPAAAFFLRLDYRNSARVFLRDRLQHSSPNSAHTEAAAAGALGVQLGGRAEYFGREVIKPLIGDAFRRPEAEDILRCNRLAFAASVLFFILLLFVQCCLLLFL